MDTVSSTLLCTPQALLDNERAGALADASGVSYRQERAVVVDWITGVHKSFKLLPRSLLSTVALFDAALARNTSLRRDLRLCAVCSLWLASKYQEIFPPDLKDYVRAADDEYDYEQILAAERDIFTTLGCNINIAQELPFYHELRAASKVSFSAHMMGRYLLNVLILYPSRFMPSVVASAVRYLISGQQYINYFKVPEDVMRVCARELTEVCRGVADSSFENYEHVVRPADKPEWERVFPKICVTIIAVRDVSDDVLRPYLRATFFRPSLALDLIKTIPPSSGRLGQGAFGSVKTVQYRGTTYAVKKTIEVDENGGVVSYFAREVSILQSLDHPGVIKLRYIDDSLRSIFLDLGTSDLHKWTQNNGPAGKTMQLDLARQLLSALVYVHDCGCLHRDVKPANIIVFADEPLRFVLADFGGGRGGQIAVRGEPFTTEVCTLWYRSPELLLGATAYDDTLDCWSVLCTLYECATGTPLFHGSTQIEQLHKIFQVLGTPSEATWRDVTALPEASVLVPSVPPHDRFFADAQLSECYQTLLQRGLIMNPAQRPRARALLSMVQ